MLARTHSAPIVTRTYVAVAMAPDWLQHLGEMDLGRGDEEDVDLRRLARRFAKSKGTRTVFVVSVHSNGQTMVTDEFDPSFGWLHNSGTPRYRSIKLDKPPMFSEPWCDHCNDSGTIGVRCTNLSYVGPGPVPEDARGVAEFTCRECPR